MDSSHARGNASRWQSYCHHRDITVRHLQCECDMMAPSWRRWSVRH